MGVSPDRLAQQLSDSNQLGYVAADVLRGNALTWVAENARVVDEAGRPVYISPAADEAAAGSEAADEDQDGDQDGDQDEDEAGAGEE